MARTPQQRLKRAQARSKTKFRGKRTLARRLLKAAGGANAAKNLIDEISAEKSEIDNG